jgi:hypothetical protein
MSLINYSFLAPIVLPKIENDANCVNLKRYTIFFNRITGEVTQEITDDNGTRLYPGKIDLSNSWINPQGKMIHKAIEKECPGCASVFFEIDSEEKAVNIGYFDEQMNFLKASKY